MKIEKFREIMKRVYALNTEEERDAFYKYAKKVPNNGVIVDIGTAGGGSAFAFTFGSKPSVKVYTIDPRKNENFLSKHDEWQLKEKLIYLEKTSAEVAMEWKLPINLLFIDGLHSFLGVTDDFNNFYPYMVDGGMVMFHDYYLYQNTVGVAVDNLEKEGFIRKVEIIDSLYDKHGDRLRVGLYIAKVKE